MSHDPEIRVEISTRNAIEADNDGTNGELESIYQDSHSKERGDGAGYRFSLRVADCLNCMNIAVSCLCYSEWNTVVYSRRSYAVVLYKLSISFKTYSSRIIV